MLPPAGIPGLEPSTAALHQQFYKTTSEMASAPLIQGRTASAKDLHENLSGIQQETYAKVHGTSQPIGLDMQRVGRHIDIKV